MNSLDLPNIKVYSKNPIFNKEHLLVLGGRAPSADWLKVVAKNRILWAVDKGLNAIKGAELFPDFLIGDNDSADKDLWNQAVFEGATYEQYPREKDFTDFELALTKLPADAFGIVTGAFGGRFDHTFSNVFSAAHINTLLCLADENEILFFLKNNDEFEIIFKEKPCAISLIPITEKCDGVAFEGVHWELKNATLYQSNPNTISNVLEDGNKCKIKIFSGILGVYASLRL